MYIVGVCRVRSGSWVRKECSRGLVFKIETFWVGLRWVLIWSFLGVCDVRFPSWFLSLVVRILPVVSLIVTGPRRRHSFRDTFVFLVLADTSKTSRTLVVELSSLVTIWWGMKWTNPCQGWSNGRVLLSWWCLMLLGSWWSHLPCPRSCLCCFCMDLSLPIARAEFVGCRGLSEH